MDRSANAILIVVAGTLLFVLLSGFIILFILLHQRRRQQHTLELQEMKNKFDQELLKSQLEIQEQTLRTISQEIHDNIGQVLSLAKLQLYGLRGNCTPADIQPTTELIGQAISDLRDLSKSLNPDRIADIGLMESIHHELQLLQKTKMMEAFFEVKGSMQRLPPEKEIIVFRIFQELMNNAIRHSQANAMHVELAYTSEHIILNVKDNGKGFDVTRPGGIGLTSMKNRSAMIDGIFNINSKENEGSVAQLVVPLQTS